MGAPSVNLKLIIAKLTRSVDKVALRDSTLFYLPSLATTLVSFILFATIKGIEPGKLNTIQVTIMASVILSLMLVAGIQFLTNTVIGQINTSEDKTKQQALSSGFTRLAILLSFIFSIIVSAIVYPYFSSVLHFSTLDFSFFVILLVCYAFIWVITGAFWALGQHKYPAIIFVFSYIVIFTFGYIGYHLGSVEFMVGYTVGVVLLLALLSLFLLSVFRGQPKPKGLWESARTLPELTSKNYWGMLFQTFLILAIFLDKIIVWASEGIKAGNGLQIMSNYTTGSFLGLIPSFSLVALAYFSEKVKRLSRNMWTGSLNDVRMRIQEYKRLYNMGLLTMLSSGSVLLALVVGFSQIISGDNMITLIALTIGLGVLFFEVILFNAFVLPVFRQSRISTVSVIIMCLTETVIALLVPKNIWFASVGFLTGSFMGFLLSHFTTKKLLSEFDYNAFRAFQLDT
jgi:uncharacterized membrane protein